MLPDIGGTELIVIAVVALIVVGPKDLPLLLRKLGQFVARLRGMANEFRASFDEMARQSELDELRREVQALRSGQLDPISDAADFARDPSVDQVMADIDAGLRGGEIKAHPGFGGAASEPDPAPAEPAATPKRKRAPARPKATADAPGKAKAKPRARKNPDIVT